MLVPACFFPISPEKNHSEARGYSDPSVCVLVCVALCVCACVCVCVFVGVYVC